MNTKSTFRLSRIVVTLAVLTPLVASRAAAESADPFHSIGYLIGEQNAVSSASSEVAQLVRGAEGPIKPVAEITADTAARSDDKAVAAAATPPTPSYDPDDRNNPPQP